MKLHSFSDLQTLQHQNPETSIEPEHDGKRKKVRVLLETKGRKGKIVTIVAGLQHNPETMHTIARMLKQHCGAGGSVKKGNIEIQGDQRERAAKLLRAVNYVVM